MGNNASVNKRDQGVSDQSGGHEIGSAMEESDFYFPGHQDMLQDEIGNFSTIQKSNTDAPIEPKVPAVFRWKGGGKEVYLSGSYDGWKARIPLSKSREDFYGIVDLPAGEHEYKFLVDGQWKVNHDEPTKQADNGFTNNVLSVKESDFEVFEALARDSSSVENVKDITHSPPGSYTQEIPREMLEDSTIHPPSLPPHLLNKVLLNQDVDLTCEPSLLPEPQHVMLNHMYALSIKDGVMALSATHRYKKKLNRVFNIVAMSSESVEVLFAKHTVDEIRDVEMKTRQEIETKKEDLRQMVGERYRDLIEAADTIAEMKQCAGNLSGAVKSLQKYTQIKFGYDDSGKKDKLHGFSIERFMEISAQVKLIMEVSETIWSQIENRNMVEATHLYLQSRQVLKNLNLDGSTTYCPILSWFPVLGQQAQALDNLRTTILNECRNLMSDDRLDSAVLAEAICSTILLENMSIETVFNEFMRIRLSAITSKYESTLDMGATKLSNAVVVMISTLKQVNTLFVSSYECDTDQSGDNDWKSALSGKDNRTDVGLVQHVLQNALYSFHRNAKQIGVLSNSFSEERIWAKHLPESVSKLILVSDLTSGTSLELTHLQAKCRQWVDDCENVIKNGTSNILLYVTSFKGLKALRETLWETLHKESADMDVSVVDSSRNNSPTSNDITTDWQKACLGTLGQHFSIWESILKDIFLGKVKVLCENLFSDLLVAAKQDIKQMIEEILSDEKDQSSLSVSEFIWSESPGDVLPDTAWRQVSIRKTRDMKGGLGLKALSVTPALQQASQRLNNAVKQTILDMSNYMPDVTKNSKETSRMGDEQSQPGVISHSEATVIHKYFQQSCNQCLQDLFNIFKEYSERCCGEDSTENVKPDELLFLSNFCRNFCYLCNEFYNGCVLGDNTEEITFKRQLSSSMTSSVLLESGHNATSATWDEICKKFLEESNQFLKMWSKTVIRKEIMKFRSWLLNLGSPALFFETIPCWDTIKIEEESESGSKVESEIRIPMSSSWPVQELLFSLCNSLGQVGGHSFNQHALQHITHSLLAGILHSFIDLKNAITREATENESDDKERIMKFQPTQSWALQKLFDLKICHGVLHFTTSQNFVEDQLFEIEIATFDSLVDWLEGYIDPFDLDVFTPYLTKNVQRGVNSTRSLFGFISVDKGDLHQQTHQSSKSGSHSHNIMPLVPDCPRFSYLPISTKTSRRDKMELPASVKNSMPLSSALKQLTEVDKKMEGGRKQSLYSKLGALSSSWLSSVTSEN